MLTLERRLELLEEIQARSKSRIAACLPPGSPKQEEDAEQKVQNAVMEDTKSEEEDAEQKAHDAVTKDTKSEEEEDEGEADPTPLATGFGMADTLGDFEVAQAEKAVEQQAILNYICLKVEAEANHHYLREARAKVDALFVDMESDEELEQWEAAIHQEAGQSDIVNMGVVYIFDDE